MEQNSILLALLLTMIAGLSTGIGSLIAFLAKRTNKRFLSFSLGFSAGVMIYISFMELMAESVHLLSELYSEKKANIYMLISFFAGIALIYIIDRLVPAQENPHEILDKDDLKNKELKRSGIMMALIIAIHNFPEGLATFASALTNLSIAIPITIAIAIHNIPEGIAVSVPIYYATGSKKKAFWYSFISGMAEPVGAVIGYLFLLPFWSPTVNALLLSFISGIMIYVSFDELLPCTERYGHHHTGVTGLVIGMAVMAISLLLL